MSTHARPLADWLAAARDEDLLRLFAARAVRADAPWHDFFDAAEALLDPASLSRVLPALTASEARALLDAASGGEAGRDREQLTALALLRPDGTPYPPVVTAIAGRSIPSRPPRHRRLRPRRPPRRTRRSGPSRQWPSSPTCS